MNNCNPISGYIKIIDFFQDNLNYLMILEYGGISLFDYILNNLPLIWDINKWKNHVRILFKQMVLYINWLHSNNVCHLDISIENCVINRDTNIVSFIDFGLSHKFDNNSFKHNKFGIGKREYMSYEVSGYDSNIKCYDARKVDIWALGVCLFSMLTGCELYDNPTKQELKPLLNGYLNDLIKIKQLKHMIDDNALSLLNDIFKPENERININEILNHTYCLF